MLQGEINKNKVIIIADADLALSPDLALTLLCTLGF